jgi:mono/diheme cytochrome c family protein
MNIIKLLPLLFLVECIASDPPNTTFYGSYDLGRRIYNNRCLSCHGSPNNNELRKVDFARFKTQVLTGGGGMPAFNLKDVEIASIHGYLRSY